MVVAIRPWAQKHGDLNARNAFQVGGVLNSWNLIWYISYGAGGRISI